MPTSRGAHVIEQLLSPTMTGSLDRFERVQLEDVLSVCRTAGSLFAAGRVLFNQSRERKRVANDADRLRKYLARFGLEWSDLKARLPPD